jgi:DNA adenine methylase
MKAKPVVRWPGGKTRMLSKILPLVRPHSTYVEAFAGGLAVLLAKLRSPAEVVNDINGDLVNLYRHAQYHLEPLIEECRWTLSSREELEGLIAQPGLTGLQRAARFLLRNRMSFGGGGSSFAVSRQGQPSRENVLEALEELNRRLDKVSVECLPWERLLGLYDGPQTLWFFDPPYASGKVENYGLWDQETMSAFAAKVRGLEGDWIVTVNDSAANRALFAGHEIQEVTTRSGTVNHRLQRDANFGELLIRRRMRKAAVAGLSLPARLPKAA